jgi:hypothetical protein
MLEERSLTLAALLHFIIVEKEDDAETSVGPQRAQVRKKSQLKV